MAWSTLVVRKTLASLLLVSGGGAVMGTNLAHAAMGACRSDPIVLLSDGATVQLYTDIFDAPTSVTHVSYVLHARVGTTVVSITYPSDMATAIPETFQLVADGKDAKYHTTTYVTDGNNAVQITTYGIATAASGAVSKTFKQNGHVNQAIKLDMNVPH
jgi:hypothetical protein